MKVSALGTATATLFLGLLAVTGIAVAGEPPAGQQAGKVQKRRGGAPPEVADFGLYQKRLLTVQPANFNFGAISAGASATAELVLWNLGSKALTIDEIRFELGSSGDSAAFTLEVGGLLYSGARSTVAHPSAIALPPDGRTVAELTFTPTAEQYDAFTLAFVYGGRVLEMAITGLGGHQGSPFLHVVVQNPDYAVDYDADGQELVSFDGSGSHTHEPGRSLSLFTWFQGGAAIATGQVLDLTLPLGGHDVTLEIQDDNQPPNKLSGDAHVDVIAANEIPGVLARYYPADPGGAAALLDAVPANNEYGEVLASYLVEGPGQIGGSPFTRDTMVRLTGELDVASDDTYEFFASGGSELRLEIDGAPAAGPLLLSAGLHEIEARFAVDGLSELPLEVEMSVAGGPAGPLDPSLLTHDQSALVPVINSMPSAGTTAGGNTVAIEGMGFFPASSVTVHWGSTPLTLPDFTAISAEKIELVTPPGAAGSIQVSIDTPQGTSNAKTYLYDPGGPVPIAFVIDHAVSVNQPTNAAWGPDGKLYVVSLGGQLTVIEFDDAWGVVDQQSHLGVSELVNNDTLGIAFNPYDAPAPVRVYVGHGQHFLNGGSSIPPGQPSPYTGQVSILEGPDFDTPIPLVTGLPTSNHDHAINELIFTHNGDLLINVGSNTNAGVPHPNSGDLPESPLSAAMVLAELSDPAFDGAVTYLETLSGLPNDDQKFGDIVDVAPGVDVHPYAFGLRNAFGAVLHTNGFLYASDNGPNAGFGAASTGPSSEGPDPMDTDEVLLVEYGNYYGSPNRNRGRYDARQNVYYPTSIGAAGSIPEVFTQAIANVPSSSNGIDEYRADTFGGQMRGDLLCQEWKGKLHRIELSPLGQISLGVSELAPTTFALGLVTGPGGAIVVCEYAGGNRVKILEPVDPVSGLKVFDITPWRAPATGGAEFVIGGTGFGTLATTTVTIGGQPASLSAVSATRIRGTVPPRVDPTPDLLDVTVSVGSESDTIEQAFRYLLGIGLEPARWRTVGSLPVALGEVSAAAVDGILYVVGEGHPGTFAYDLMARVGVGQRAMRLFVGHHHAAEVIDGRLWLVGGLGGGSPGQVQVYSPETDTWTIETTMPWAGGSVSTAVIGGKLYVCGGIVAGVTVDNTAVYDPDSGTWTPLAPMPAGRNHAAFNTDGQKLYVFGGRTGGNTVANGFDDVQIYDPATDTWETSANAASGIPPLPQARGGMGRAVFSRGEFYVFGGETLTGPGANPNKVYDRVDVYDPLARSWRTDRPMPDARHGIYPVLFQSRIFLPGGGTAAGNSQSKLFDEFLRL